MNHSDKSKRHPKYWVSGERAKNFRRKLGASASSGKSKHTLTFKFPLAAGEPDETARKSLRFQYRQLASINEDSLFHFFAAVHLAGFRLFDSAGSAKQHINSGRANHDEFNRKFHQAFQSGESAGTDLLGEIEKDFRGQNKSIEGVKKRVEKVLGTRLKNEKLSRFVDALSKRITHDKLWSSTYAGDRRKAFIEACKGAGVDLELPQENDYRYRVLWDSQTQSFLSAARYKTEEDLEYAMHQMVSLAAFITRANNSKPVSETDIKKILLSDNVNYNALDWLFNVNEGKGVWLFAQPMSVIKERKFHIDSCPERTMKKVQTIAENILNNDNVSYHKFRMLFGGGIASFISNYWKRLGELKRSMEKLFNQSSNIEARIEQLEKEFPGISGEFEQVIAGGAETLKKMLANLPAKSQEAQKSIRMLMGEGDRVASKDEVETMEEFSEMYEECRGLVMQLAEVIRKRKRSEKGNFEIAKKYLPNHFFPEKSQSGEGIEDAAQFLRRKLNRYRGAPVYSPDDINDILRQDSGRLKKLRRSQKAHWKNISSQVTVKIVEGHEITERQRLSGRMPMETINVSELACRKILSRIAGAVRICHNARIRNAGIALFDESGVFHNDTDAIGLFAENKGRLYKSPFSSYRHDALELGVNFKGDRMRGATEKFFDRFCQWVEGLGDNDMQSLRDVVALEQCMYGLRVGGVMNKVPSGLAKPDQTCELMLPVSVRVALEESGRVTPGIVARIFNAYRSEISGLCAKLSRSKVSAKSRLQYIGDSALYYMPKMNKNWRLPDAITSGKSDLAKGWDILRQDSDLFVDGDTTNGIRAERLADAVRRLKQKSPERVFRACLRQMPHNWYYKAGKHYPRLKPDTEEKHAPFISDEQMLDGVLEVKKGEITIKRRENPAHYIRLAGPSRYKGWLDKALLNDDQQKVTFGDTSLIVEEEYAQSLSDGVMRADYRRTHLHAAVVFNAEFNASQNREFPLARKFIAIDLGERGIGYAVFSVPKEETTDPIMPSEVGHVVMPVLRHLIKRVDNYRAKKQPLQRFQSNNNKALQQMREAAIGELAGVIDGLLEKHQAFPVFESSVGNFERGGRMLKTIYGSILQLYTFSNVDAHKTKRARHWLVKNGPRWEHPFLRGASTNKPVLLFPGTSVNPAYTSQMCSEYGKNPVGLIRELSEDIPLNSDNNGMLALGLDADAPRIYIYGGGKSRYKSDNPLPSLDGVKKNHSFRNWGELEKHVRDQLRHKPPSKRSKDTTQSSYLSPFVDVQNKLSRLSDEEMKSRRMFRRNGLVFMHADVNAAVNIGRKWWCKITAENG